MKIRFVIDESSIIIRVLEFLAHNGNKEMIATKISKGLGLHYSNLNGLIMMMEKDGLIQREVPLKNRRKKVIILTKKGRQLVEDCNAIINKYGAEK